MNNMGNGYEKGKVDVGWWLRELHKAIAWRKKKTYEAKWETWRKFYRGEYGPGVLPANLFFQMLRTTVPRVYFRNPSISLTSKKPGILNEAATVLLQRVDNNLIRNMRVKQQMKGIVQDAFLFGTGIGKLGYGALFTPTPEMGGTENPVSKKHEVYEYNSSVHDDMPWFLRIPTGNFLVPEGTVNYEDARWSAVWVRRSVWDVQNDPRLRHNKNLGASNAPELENVKMPEKGNQVDLFEIRDKKFQTVFILAPYNTDKVLYYDLDEFQLNGRIPNYPAVFNQDDNCFWGVPDSQVLEPQQLEANEIRTQMMYHRRMSVRRVFARRGSMDAEEADKMLTEDPVSVIWTKDDPRSCLFLSNISGVSNDQVEAYELIQNDVRDLIGFSRNQLANYAEGSADRTATEAKIVQAASEIRVDERRDIIADMLVDVIRDMHQVMFAHWDQKQIVQVAGPEGLPVWVSFTPSMLSDGDYEVAIDPDDMVPDTKQVREQRAMLVYKILAENPLIDPVKLTKYLLREMPGISMEDLMKQASPGMPGSQQNPLNMQQYVQRFQQAGASPAAANASPMLQAVGQ